MNLYNEYNRIRKNMLQNARRHNLPKPSIPTAKQLGRRIKISDIHSINRQKRQQLKLISKQSSTSIVTKIKVPSAKIPKSSAKKSNFSIPRTSIEAFDKYATRFTATDQDGNVINKKTGEVIASSVFATKEVVGQHILDNFTEEDFKLDDNVSIPTEIELLKQYLEQRVRQAHEEIQSQHRTSIYYQFGGGSKVARDELTDAIENFDAKPILEAISKMGEKEAQEAMKRFYSYTDEIRNYIDIALFYTSDYTEGEHARALDYILDMLQLPITDVIIKDNYDLPEFDLDYGEES